MNIRTTIIGTWIALTVVLAASPVAPSSRLPIAPATQAAPQPEQVPESVALDELGRGTPRGTVTGFRQATLLRDYRRAARYLDLRDRRPGPAVEDGPTLAYKLRVVLDNTRIDLAGLPDEPEGAREPGMRPGRQTVSRVEVDNEAISIVLERVPREDGLLIWQFSRDTLKRVPDLYWRFSYGVVGQWLPPMFIETRVIGLALWQWIGLVLLGSVSYLIARLVVRPGLPLTRRLFAATRLSFDDSWAKPPSPMRTLVGLAIFRACQPLLSLPLLVLPAVTAIQKLLLVVALAWLGLRLIAGFCLAARRRVIARGENPNFIDLVQRALRIGLGVLAVVLLLEAVGVQPTTLIAAVGVGGIGIALAAQRTVENLFSGLVLIGDQPVRVGDLCRVGTQMGTVERIGLWSTRIRTLERSVVSIPNAQFFTLQVDNLQQRDRILFSAVLRLRYETSPEQLRAVLSKVREVLRNHPRVDPEPARVRFTGFGNEALEVEVFAYLRTTDHEDYLSVREELCLTIMDIVAGAGAAFALPERTIRLVGDGRAPLGAASSARQTSTSS